MEKIPSQKNEIMGVRHLEDEEALMTYGFDTPLKEGQESLVREIADKIIDDCRNLSKNKIDFIS
jgi:hypothetical protein